MTATPQTSKDKSESTDSALATSELSRVVGARVRELRLNLGMTMAAFAADAGISLGMLSKIEHGQTAASLTTLARLAATANVPFTALFRGLDEEHDLVIVRADERHEIIHAGSGIGRMYQDLGSLRGPTRTVEPMIARLTEADEVFPLYQHAGIEFLYIFSGSMDYGYGDKSYRLNPGDSVHLHGEVAHGPTALHELPVEFLSLKVYPTATDQ